MITANRAEISPDSSTRTRCGLPLRNQIVAAPQASVLIVITTTS